MKLIIGYVNPYKVDALRDALKEEGITGMSVSVIQGFGRQGGHKEVYRGAEYEVDFVAKSRIEIIVTDEQASSVVSKMAEVARTGSLGDGKIAVLPVEDVVRIRTGERGEDAV